MKKGILKTAAVWLLTAAPLAATAALYGSIPGQVPIQWGLDGAVQYGPKYTLWFLSLLGPAVAAAMRVLPRVDPRRENYSRFGKAYDAALLSVILLMDLLYAVTVSEALYPGRISVYRVVPCGVGLLFAVLGNVMPKFKSNFFAGVRTPWSLSDPDVWNRTQRLGGRIFFVLGLVLILSGLFLPEWMMAAAVVAGVGAVLVVPTVMSYLWYREKYPKGE